MTKAEAARAMLRTCRRLWEAGLVAGRDGNVSVRLGPDRLLVTPAGLPKADLETADLVVTDLAGHHVAGRRRASSELDLHLRIYRHVPSAGAVVHAHPPVATGFAVAGVRLETAALAELALTMGDVPVVPYAQPGTPALGDAVEPHLASHVALLLANHGAVAWGETLLDARIRMETLEHGARIILAARQVGRVRRLTAAQMAALTGRPEPVGAPRAARERRQ